MHVDHHGPVQQVQPFELVRWGAALAGYADALLLGLHRRLPLQADLVHRFLLQLILQRVVLLDVFDFQFDSRRVSSEHFAVGTRTL